MPSALDALSRLRELGSPEAARLCERFFKTGPGQYAAGDVFVGVKVPIVRTLAKEYRELDFDQLATLLTSEIHEARLLALLIAGSRMGPADEGLRRRIYDFYISNRRWVNNWDLVDSSAPHIVGVYLQNKNRSPIYDFAKSSVLWERRISILATQQFIKQREFSETLMVSEMLLADPEDLIHKAVGWMLREVGKKDEVTLVTFLDQRAAEMPRTMLRYAIERLTPEQRTDFLSRRGQKSVPGARD